MNDLPPTVPAGAAAGRDAPARRRIGWMAGAAGALALLLLAAPLAWNCDDAFIAFRYSRHLAEGNGLRFNLGVEPPVEGYTQLGWVLMVAAIEWLKLDVVLATRTLEIASGLVLVALVARIAAVRLGLGRAGALGAALFLATSPTAVVWSTGGLGTAFFALSVFALGWCLHGSTSGRAASASATGVQDDERASSRVPALLPTVLAGFAVSIMRFDGAYWLTLLFAIAVLRGLVTKDSAYLVRSLVCAGWIIATIAVQTVWRVLYHGDWLPNTARAKAGGSLAYLDRGLEYLATYWATVPATLVLLALSFAFWRGERAWWWRACSLTALGTFAYGALTGGDFMPFGRFYLPALPFLALVAGAAIERVARARGPALATAVGALLVGTSLPALFDLHLTPTALREAVQFRHGRPYETEYAFWQGEQERRHKWEQVGRALAQHTPPDASVVRTSIGAVGYYSRRTLYDSYGLVDRQVALEAEADPERPSLPGHDVLVTPDFFADRAPTYRYVALRFGVREGTPEAEAVRNQGAPGEVRELYFVRAEDGFDDDGVLILTRF